MRTLKTGHFYLLAVLLLCLALLHLLDEPIHVLVHEL